MLPFLQLDFGAEILYYAIEFMSHLLKKMPPLILFLFGADLAFGLLYLVNAGLHWPFPEIMPMLNLDGEANLPTWYSSMQLLIVAGLLALFALNRVKKKDRQSWSLLLWPLIFVFLAMDEIVGLHEWLGMVSDALLPGGSRRNTLLAYTGVWMFLLGIPFLLLMFTLLASLKKYLREQPAVSKKLLWGLIIFIGAACGIEIFSNFVSHTGKFYVLEVFSEELGEMLGETLLVWAAFELSRTFSQVGN